MTQDRAISDPVRLEVFNQRLLAVTEDMGARLVRSSFSPNIKERRDCSVGLFGIDGRVIAQAAHIPIHLGSLVGGVEALLAAYPPDEMRPGDAYVCNDAYLAGGTHLPDIAVLSPVFCDGAPRFLVGCVGHHADVGGPVPGSISPDAASIFEEGIRIPPTRLARAGEIDPGVLGLIAHNTREPEERMLDLRVQVSTNAGGVADVLALVAQAGLAEIEDAVADLYHYTHRRLAAAVAALPDGRYTGEAWLDDDGAGGEPVPIRVAVEIAGERLRFDFGGTGAQSRGAFNVMPSGVLATVAYAVKALLDPELPPNSGLFDAFDLVVPAGTILNPHFPAAVGARTTTCQRLASAIFAAFGGGGSADATVPAASSSVSRADATVPAASSSVSRADATVPAASSSLLPPERRMASSHDVLAAMVFSGRSIRGGRTYVYLETVGGGIGGRGSEDGMDAAHVHITNSLNMPVEAVELEYPLRVESYRLIPDSGGAGRVRGGLGIAREVRVLAEGTTFSARADGFRHPSPGMDGGLPAGPCRVVRNGGTDAETVLAPKQRMLALEPGETVRMETPGGAGLGRPAERPVAALAADLRDGKVTPAAARRDYGERLASAALALSGMDGTSE